ncbi:hypothetical protein RHGRI_014070 [Rhododendron griersonianum]|uniref:Glycine-rich RNA-binding protein RZ1A n=1 Tax=Rhododendron griersonianum TaxID=479676 RepID=A0AAV6K808_9ERIC|nr:hypothetical protein RHGRI_014070 [Rhododendron griersonianum]
MSDELEYRCFIGGLAWSTSDRGLKDAFAKFGHLVEAKVAVDKFSGRSRGFGFVTFDENTAMEEAIEAMNGMDLDGRSITVEKAQPSGRDRDSDRPRDRDRGRDRDGGSRGSGGGGECFKCGKPGHFARECPGEGGRGGDRYGGRDDRYGGGGGGRYGPDRNGDRSGGRNRDSGGYGGGDRYNRDRSGPYDRRGSGAEEIGGSATGCEAFGGQKPVKYEYCSISYSYHRGADRRVPFLLNMYKVVLKLLKFSSAYVHSLKWFSVPCYSSSGGRFLFPDCDARFR